MQEKIITALVFLFFINSAFTSDIKIKSPSLKKFNTIQTSPEEEANATIETMKTGIEGINSLLTSDLSATQKNKFLISKMQLQVQLGKRLAFDKATEKQGSLYFTDALKLSKTIETTTLTQEDLSRYYFNVGTAHALNQSTMDASNNYEYAVRAGLQTGKDDPKIPWMAFYIAEENFDADQIEKAKIYYSKFYTKFSPTLQELATYKLAWCELRLNQFQKSVDYFTKIIKSSKDQALASDSKKDVAFALSKSYSDIEIIKWVDNLNIKQDDRQLILKQVYIQQETLKTARPDSKIFNIVYENEKDLNAKFKLLLSLLSSVKKEYATREHYNSFLRLYKFIKENIDFKLDDTNKGAFDIETQGIIKVFYETYIGKINGPEQIDKATLAKFLKILIPFQLRFFKTSLQRSALAQIWLNILNNQKDWRGVIQANQYLSKDQSLKRFHSEWNQQTYRAYEMIINDKNKNHFITWLKNWCENETTPKEDLLICENRLAKFALEEKNFTAAVVHLKRIYELKPNVDIALNYLKVLFDLNKYDLIQTFEWGDKLLPNKEQRVSWLSLKRESALKLALQAKAENNAINYKKWIDQFITNSTDQKKTALARRDLFNFYFENKKFDLALTEIQSTPKTDLESTYETDLTKIGEHYLETLDDGNLIKLSNLIKTEQLKLNQNVYFFNLIHWAVDINFSKKNSLLKPEELTHLTSLEKAFNIPAVKNQSSQLEKTELPIELKLKKINTKSKPPSKSTPSWDRQLKAWIDQIRPLRKQVVQSIKNQTLDTQTRVLFLAQSTEKFIAASILQSPLPIGLDSVQINEYKTALSQITKEFEDQANEYQLLTSKISLNADNSKKQEETKYPKFFSSQKWKWPDISGLDLWVQRGLYKLITVYADLKLAKKQIEQEDYYRLRSGARLANSNSDFIIRSVVAELEEADQDSILSEWRGIKP